MDIKKIMEVCVESVESAVNAERGGARRIELCSNLSDGGTTPSVGLLKVVKSNVKIPVFVIIRPRGGDFLYSNTDFEVMKQDVQFLLKEGADGIVFGILNRDGAVDESRCLEILKLIPPHIPTTFHRAFDMTKDPLVAVDTLINLGFKRILTSGQACAAIEGIQLIKGLITRGGRAITIMPGCGINSGNLDEILAKTGAVEFHGSASTSIPSLMEYRNESIGMGTNARSEYSTRRTDTRAVADLVAIAAKYNVK